MSYEVETPALRRAMSLLDHAADGLESGSLEARQANHLAMNARARVSVVGMDIKARLAAPKITSQEAKLIELASKPEELEHKPE